MIKLIEKIEGEAKLDFKFQEGKIEGVSVDFMSTRHIEDILRNKPAMDALVINPRVCGICGHAHLIATVQALEACYAKIEIPQKARIIRELTLNFELIQNHFKWFYLTILPFFEKKQDVTKALYPTRLMGKAIAVLGGQYPHTSYALVGGVACEVTTMDIVQIERYLDEVLEFFQNTLLNIDENSIPTFDAKRLFASKGDLVEVLKKIEKNGWMDYGKSYDRFICFGENSLFKRGKSYHKRLHVNISIDQVHEKQIATSFAKSVYFNNKHYEVGPLARAIVNKDPLIKSLHNLYGDSIVSRITARVYETATLLLHSKKLLRQVDLNQPSYIKPKLDIAMLSGEGASAVEAARGSLIHKVKIEEGLIKKYEIITPTQWNLCGEEDHRHGVSQQAMIGLEDITTAEMVFKTFDVCSVCTTH